MPPRMRRVMRKDTQYAAWRRGLWPPQIGDASIVTKTSSVDVTTVGTGCVQLVSSVYSSHAPSAHVSGP